MQSFLHRILFICIFCTFSFPMLADALQNGIDAHKAGRYKDALKIWLPLARDDNAKAMFNVGMLYMNSQGVKQDYPTAIKWFKRAAYYGNADAAYNLGYMYMKGQGAYPSKKTAVYWWSQAAKFNHADSQYNLGVMYAYGHYVKRDGEMAIKYWQMAAKQGHKVAARAIVEAYTKGLFGLKVDPAKARQWLPYTN